MASYAASPSIARSAILALKGLYYAMWRQQVGERRLPARDGEAPARRLAAV